MELERHLMKMTMTIAMKMESKAMEMIFPTGSGRDSLDLHDLNTERKRVIGRHHWYPLVQTLYLDSFVESVLMGKYEDPNKILQISLFSQQSIIAITGHLSYCTWRPVLYSFNFVHLMFEQKPVALKVWEREEEALLELKMVEEFFWRNLQEPQAHSWKITISTTILTINYPHNQPHLLF